MTTTLESALSILQGNIMGIPTNRTMSHFATTYEMDAYFEGHRDARHAAMEAVLEFRNTFRNTLTNGLEGELK